MIIAVGGSAASGKSTLARALARRLGYAHISAGAIMREMAAERDLSLLEFSQLAEADDAIDGAIDERQKREAAKGDCIVDGRLSAFMIPHADVKVYLTAPLETRAARVAERDQDEVASVEDAQSAITLREESERKRYKDIYGIDLADTSIYDLTVNTQKWGIEETQELVAKAIELLN